MQNTLLVLQLVVSVLLLLSILVQVKGTGFGRVWGSMNVSPTRRGLERIIFRFTFLLSGMFILISILALLA